MNKHLQLVRDFHKQLGMDQSEQAEAAHLSEIDIVMHQALLMGCGNETFKAIYVGDLPKILAGLIDLSYYALSAIVCKSEKVIVTSGIWQHDISMLTIMRILSDKINNCSSGESVHYSALYTLCEELVRGFLNADFDQAFQIVHNNAMKHAVGRIPAHNIEQRIERASLPVAPDLSETFFE